MRSMSAEVTVKPLNLLRHQTAQFKQHGSTKVRVSISISQDLLEMLDQRKGLASRSAYVEKLLRDQLGGERPSELE